MRYPDKQKRETQPNALKKTLSNLTVTLRDRTYNLLSQKNDWISFASDYELSAEDPLSARIANSVMCR